MAEKNVSGPPLPTARSTKPVSEALLNEKVRESGMKDHLYRRRTALGFDDGAQACRIQCFLQVTWPDLQESPRVLLGKSEGDADTE